MRTLISLFVVCAVLVSCSCKQQKKVAETEPPVAKKPVEPLPPSQQNAVLSEVKEPQMEEAVDRDGSEASYRLMVSFTSIGEGVDGAAGEKLMEIITQHETTYGMPLRYDRFQRGREGEYVMCFQLLNENEKARNNFIDKVKEALGKNKLVIITENGTYKK